MKKKSMPPRPPFGNKYAVGNKGGRPKEYDVNEEMEALLEWGQKDTSLRLYGFCKERMYPSSQLCEFADESPEFSANLRMVKEWLALRREEHANDDMIKSHVYNKTAHIYDSELVERDEDIKDRQLSRQIRLLKEEILAKSQAGIIYDEDMLAAQKAVLDQLSEAQSLLKRANSRIKSDS